MRMLAVLVAVAVSVVAIWAVVYVGGRYGEKTSTPIQALPAQHLTLDVLNERDDMAGPELLLRPGPVVLTIMNHARHAHTFSVPGLGVERFVKAGSPANPTKTVVRFVAQRGWFPWYCRLPCGEHMVGDLYVSANPPRLHGSLWANSTT